MFYCYKNKKFARRAMMLLVALLSNATSWADVTYTATAGSSDRDSESYTKLVDGDKSTKWCVTYSSNSHPYIEFNTSAAITPIGYTLTTGYDTQSNSGRNPTGWILQAKANSEDDWTTLVTVTDDATLGAVNTTDYTFSLSNSTAYLYYRFEVTAVKSGTILQLGELTLRTSDDATDLTLATVSGVDDSYAYTGSAIDVTPTVTALFGTALTAGTDYTVSLTCDGSAVDEVKEEGTYTMTITGTGSYTGTKTATFDVSLTCTATGGTAGKDGESYPELVDGDKSTKWCATLGSPSYVEFNLSAAITPIGYTLTTGSDTQTYPSRNPASWVLKAKNSGDSDWTTLVAVTDDATLGAVNTTDYTFSLTNSTAYQYYRFEVSAVQGTTTTLQLGELTLRTSDDATDLTLAAVSGVDESYAYTGSAITVTPTVTALDGTALTAGTNYTVSLTCNGSAVDNVTDIGTYTMTITGTGSYTGSITETFNVVGTLSGSGTSADPYTIASADDWNLFAANISSGINCTSYYKLTANITVTTTAGTSTYPFAGHFLGNNKTITANISDQSAQGTALFRYISGATISNLTVSGSVTGTTHCAALVGFAVGTSTNTLDNITVNATVTTSGTHCGGILGHGKKSKTTITNSVFAGSIDGGTHVGVLWGWSDSGCTPTITNCLEEGIRYTGTNVNPVGLISTWGTVTSTYYLKATTGSPNQNTTRGTQVYTTATTLTKCITGTKGTYYPNTSTVSDVSDYYIYTGSAISLGYTVTDDQGTTMTEGTDYTVSFTCNGSAADNATNIGTYTVTFTGTGNYTGSINETFEVAIGLANDANNSTTIKNFNGQTYDVVLSDRTLYKDGDWNTLCLPFALASLTGTPLEGADVRTLVSSSLSNSTLSMSFSESSLTAIEAGKPYLVKWASGDNIVNPVFSNVTISNTTANVETTNVYFVGSYDPVEFISADNTVLYLSTGSTLYYPSEAMTFGTCRAHFKLQGDLTAYSANGIKAFKLDFNGTETGIRSAEENENTTVYDLSGRKVQKMQKGLYIVNGKKILK